MNSPQTKKTLINIAIAIAALGVAFGAYWMFFRGDSSLEDAPSAEDLVQTVVVAEEVARTMRELQTLKTSVAESVALFGTPAFKNLEDFSQVVSEEPVGRANPFTPTEWKIKKEAENEAIKKASKDGASVVTGA